jgi:hypothetical protein
LARPNRDGQAIGKGNTSLLMANKSSALPRQDQDVHTSEYFCHDGAISTLTHPEFIGNSSLYVLMELRWDENKEQSR